MNGLPPLGQNPGHCGTTPGSFANPPRIGTPYTFSSPDTPGMPEPSNTTAMNFSKSTFADCNTQLLEARHGQISDEMKFVATREPHLTPAQIRAEIAAGRMIIPANKVHL